MERLIYIVVNIMIVEISYKNKKVEVENMDDFLKKALRLEKKRQQEK